MGTSLNVQPNAAYPEQCLIDNPDGKIVICNLQATPYDQVAAVRLFCKTDDFMSMLVVCYFRWSIAERVQEELGIEEIDCSVDIKKSWPKQTKEQHQAQIQAGIASQWEKVERRARQTKENSYTL
jgi:hypothetical protein